MLPLFTKHNIVCISCAIPNARKYFLATNNPQGAAPHFSSLLSTTVKSWTMLSNARSPRPSPRGSPRPSPRLSHRVGRVCATCKSRATFVFAALYHLHGVWHYEWCYVTCWCLCFCSMPSWVPLVATMSPVFATMDTVLATMVTVLATMVTVFATMVTVLATVMGLCGLSSLKSCFLCCSSLFKSVKMSLLLHVYSRFAFFPNLLWVKSSSLL